MSQEFTPRASVDDLEIKSIDIDRKLITIENHNALKALFQHLDDDTIARYLIARNNDLTKSTDLLTKAQNWRNKHYPVLKRDCIEDMKTGKMYVHGTDREGRPLLFFRTNLHDPSTRDIATTARNAIWWMEYAINKLPDNKSKITIILDRDGAAMSNTDIEFLRAFVSLFQDQFPERLYRAVVVPANVLFWSVWKVASVFVHPVTREKVKTLMFQSALSEFVDPEFIPTRLGGNSKYDFNIDDYDDFYSAEVLAKSATARNEDGSLKETGTFFSAEDAAAADF